MHIKHLLKGFLSISLSLSLMASCLVPVAADTKKANDIASSTYKTTIQTYINKGYIKAYPDGSFKPSTSITRLEFMVMVNQAMSLSLKAQINYTDVKTKDWFYQDIQKGALYMRSNGGLMKPNEALTRIDFAYALIKLGNINATKPNSKILGQLKDGKALSTVDKGIVSAVMSRGLFKGFVTTSFIPTQTVRREEAVAVFDRLLRQRGIVITSKSSIATVYSDIWKVDNITDIISDIPYNTSLSTFKASLLAPDNGKYDIYLADGKTVANAISTGCKVITTSETGTHKTYTITVQDPPLNKDATVKSAKWIINDNEGIISNIPAFTSIDTFKSNIAPPLNGDYEVYISDGFTPAKVLETGCKLVATAEDGSNKAYTIKMNPPAIDVMVMSSKWIVNNTNNTIMIHTGTTLPEFKANLAPPSCGIYEVYTSDGKTIASTLENGYKLTTTAQNPAYHKTYTLYFTNVSVTSSKWSVNDTLGNIINVPSGISLNTFETYIKPPVNGSYEIYLPDGKTIADDLQSNYLLITTNIDGSHKTYVILTDIYNNITSLSYTVDDGAGTISDVPPEITMDIFKNNIKAPIAGSYEVYLPNGTTPASEVMTGYKVITTAKDGTHKVYTINLSASLVIFSDLYIVNDSPGIISNVPAGTTLEEFKSHIFPPLFGSFQVYRNDGKTGASDLQSGYVLTTTGQDGKHKSYMIFVNAP